MRTRQKSIVSALLILLIIVTSSFSVSYSDDAPAVSASSEIQCTGLRLIGQGKADRTLFVPPSGVSVMGNTQAVFNGEKFFSVMTDADKKVIGYWYSTDGVCLGSTLICDESEREYIVSQPSACVVGDTIVAAWVASDHYGDDGGNLRLRAIASDGTPGPIVQLNDSRINDRVKARRPGIASDGSGLYLSMRVYSADYDDWYRSDLLFGVYISVSGTGLTPGNIVMLNTEDNASGNFYPTVAYAANPDKFLVVWQRSATRVYGLVLDKNISQTPSDNPVIFDAVSGCNVNQVRAASDGNGFAVIADFNCGSSYGDLWINTVSSSGIVGTPRTIVSSHGTDISPGDLLWDGEQYILSYSKERENADLGTDKIPDIRYNDCYMYAFCISGEGGASAYGNAFTVTENCREDIASAWWHEIHPRMTVDNDGHIFCTYVREEGNGGSFRPYWCMFEGSIEKPVPPISIPESGLHLCAEFSWGYNFYGGDGKGDVAFAAFNGSVYKYDMQSAEWTSLHGTNIPSELTGFSVLDDSHFYASGWAGMVPWLNYDEWRHSYVFDSWGAIPPQTPALGVYAAASGFENLYAAAEDSKIYRSAANDPYWVLSFDGGLYGVDFNDIHGNGPNCIYAVGDGGLIARFNGTAWETIQSGVAQSLNGVYVDENGEAWICGDYGTILHVSGDDCEITAQMGGADLFDIWGAFSDLIFICGEKGTALVYDGTGWSSIGIIDDEGQSTSCDYPFTNLFGVYDENEVRLFVTSTDESLFYTLSTELPEHSGTQLITASYADGRIEYNLRSDAAANAKVYAAAYDSEGKCICFGEGSDGVINISDSASYYHVFLMDEDLIPLAQKTVLHAD